MATLAHGLTGMDSSGRARRESVGRTHVARGALGGNRNIGVKYARVPAGKACPVTCVAIRNRNAAQCFIRNVVSTRTVCRGIPTRVARCTLLTHRHLGMVPRSGFPGCGGVARGAVQGGRNVGSRLTSCRTSVVAGRAIRGSGEAAVIHTGCGKPSVGFMASPASRLGRQMPRRLSGGDASVVATAAAGLGNAYMVKPCASK